MEYTKALVTGGSGFIGSHLVDALIAAGKEVTVIDKVDPVSDSRNSAAKYIRLDIKDAAFRQTVIDVTPEVVFHLAAHIDDRESVKQPVMNAEENVLGTINVFEAARAANARKIIFASTGVVYGNAEQLPITEEALPRPLTPYAVSKLTGERYAHFYWLLHKLPYVAFRIANVYGPRQEGSKECGVVAVATERLLKGQECFQNNDGQTTRDYIHVSDIVSAMLAAASSEEIGVYNLGTGVQTSTSDVLKMISSALTTSPTITPRPEVADAVKHIALNPAKAQKALGWSPKVKLADGIRETVAWYQSRV